MLEILHGSAKYSYNTLDASFRAGMIATFVGNREIAICTDKTIPIGFFVNGSNEYRRVFFVDGSNEYRRPFENRIESVVIAVGQGEYQTDICEEGEYRINDLLYCSPNGRITNNVFYRGNPTVGIVNSVERSEFLWIGFITYFSNFESIFNNQKTIKPEILNRNVKIVTKRSRYTILLEKKRK